MSLGLLRLVYPHQSIQIKNLTFFVLSSGYLRFSGLL